MTRKNNKKLRKIREHEEFEQKKRAIIDQYRNGLIEKQQNTFSQKSIKLITIFCGSVIIWIVFIIMFSGFLKLSDMALSVLGIICSALIANIGFSIWQYFSKSKAENISKSNAEIEKLKLVNTVDNVVDTVADIVSGREG